MVPSRIIAVPGVRTSARPRWSTEVGTALAVVVGQPALWLLGALGFALRGGIVLLTLPILVLPTQVEFRLALGANLGSSGLTPGFWGLVALGAFVSAVLALLALLLLARVEMFAFDRLTADAESGDMRAWRPPIPLSRGQRRLLYSRVFTIQALGLLAICLFAVPLASSIGPATLDELIRPSSSDTIYIRVLNQLVSQLALLVAGIVIVEMVTAVATRELLLSAAGYRGSRPRRVLGALSVALSAPIRAPLRTLRTVVLGWTATLVALVPVLWAIGIVWQATRASFLATTSVADMVRDPGSLMIAFALAAVFIGGMLLAGFISALRASLWTLDALGDEDTQARLVE